MNKKQAEDKVELFFHRNRLRKYSTQTMFSFIMKLLFRLMLVLLRKNIITPKEYVWTFIGEEE
jgi:hypothetical protein